MSGDPGGQTFREVTQSPKTSCDISVVELLLHPAGSSSLVP